MFIFSNLAISLDGKIATANREHFPLGTPEDRKQMIVLRRRSDAILMGASTLRAYQRPLMVKDKPEQPLNVILSSSLEGLDPSWKFFTENRIRRLIFIDERAPEEKIAQFRETCELVKLKKPGMGGAPSLAQQMMNELIKRGVQSLLVEGGGNVMWLFAEDDLIDEYNVTITPRILGGTEAPTLVDGPGFHPDQVVNLKLKECRIVGDELYLVYEKTGSRGRDLPA